MGNDLVKPVVLQIEIQHDGKVVWVNTEEGCKLRATRIGTLLIKDSRTYQYLIDAWHGLTKLLKSAYALPWINQTSPETNINNALKLIEIELRKNNIDPSKLEAEHESQY